MTVCQHRKKKTKYEEEDNESFELEVCDECGEEVSRVSLLVAPDGEVRRRPTMPPPQTFSRQTEPPKLSQLPTAKDLFLASQAQAELKLKEKVSEIISRIWEKAGAAVGEGQTSCEFILAKEECTAAVVKQLLEEVRGLGYKVKRELDPTRGICLQITWKQTSTSKKSSRKTRKSPLPKKVLPEDIQKKRKKVSTDPSST